ncbi:ATP-binding protein [Actinomycetaceae bacterium MB13-C1-2]|nr:ATP-binding protein [Actinomycetaceae bacterium MB13-C1-2]
MISVDGRTDLEKLRELLLSPEETHLEFKSKLNLKEKKGSLDFVKDAVSMANRHPGGYILIGVNDDSTPSLPIGSIKDRSVFDSARLGDLIRKYIEGEIHIVSQFHEIDEQEIVLIYARAGGDGLPIPMSTVGQYDDPKKGSTVVFRKGDILIREGAANVPFRHAHWAELLKVRDERIRAESTQQTNDLIAELAKTLRAAGTLGVGLTPLAMGMAEEAFYESLTTHLDRRNTAAVKQFLAKTWAIMGSESYREEVLNKITIIAVSALSCDDLALFKLTTDKLFDLYSTYARHDPQLGLDIVNRIYIVGSLAVRMKTWEVIPQMTIRPFSEYDDGYAYTSWIRHGQVEATRAKLFPGEVKGLMISIARDLMNKHEHFRPDIPNEALPKDENVTNHDLMLDSLCQFDILYCLTVTANPNEHESGFGFAAYPASAAFNQTRVDPAFVLVVRDPRARKQLFPRNNDAQIARAIKDVFAMAQKESSFSANHWWHLPDAVQQFVDAHKDSRPDK